MHSVLESPLPLFVAQAIVIVLASRLLGVGARLVGQPLVIAEIVAGILLGPSLLGAVAPSVEAALFPASSMGALGLTSQVGLVLFMFLVGLELDPKLLRGRGRAAVAIGNASIAVPFALGVLLAVELRDDYAPRGVGVWPFALFMGAAMSITAFPVLARILVERRLIRSRIGAISIACAAFGDITAWCILAFVVSVARADGLSSALRTVVLALAYAGGMTWIVRPAIHRWADRTKLGLTQNLVAGTFLALLASSWIAEAIGIHALFGAFVFGAVLPKGGPFAAAMAEKVEDVVVVLLLPLFFAFSGLRTQLGLLDTPGAWLTCGVVIAVACVGKFGGSAVAGRLAGLSWRESGAVGVLMNTRGLMELVVLNIGLDLGVISPRLFTMMVVMALVTTFITTPLLQRIYPAEELLRELAAEDAPASVQLPARYTALVCVAFERSGPGLLTLGAAIAGVDERTSRLYALRLVTPANRASFVMEQRAGKAQGADTALSPLLERARELSVKVRTVSFVSAEPARDICDVADVKGADIILLGWHKPVLGGTMLSGTVHEVMEHARSDVGVFVDHGLREVARVLVPFIDSEHDRAALTIARRIAEQARARVTVLHVVPPDRASASQGAEAQTRDVFHEGDAERGYDVEFRVVTHADPAHAVIEESARGYDLLIVGLGRSWGLEHRSFGLQAEAILKECAISVLVVSKSTGSRGARAAQPSLDARRRFETKSDA